MSTVSIRLAFAVAAVLFLAGCQSTTAPTSMSSDSGTATSGQVVTHSSHQTEPNESVGATSTGQDVHSNASASDPLLDAPHRAEITCTASEPVSVLKRFREVAFACPDLGVSVNYDELLDAGWRLLDLNIGDEMDADGHVGLPITLRLRKLF